MLQVKRGFGLQGSRAPKTPPPPPPSLGPCQIDPCTGHWTILRNSQEIWRTRHAKFSRLRRLHSFLENKVSTLPCFRLLKTPTFLVRFRLSSSLKHLNNVLSKTLSKVINAKKCRLFWKHTVFTIVMWTQGKIQKVKFGFNHFGVDDWRKRINVCF